jgi:hypothetical protein
MREWRMATWADLAAGAPRIAAEGERLLHWRGEIEEGLLASVRGDAPPRIHPIYVQVVDGRLYGFIGRSAKRTDLEQDGRYAFHAHQDPAVPHEFEVRGRAAIVPPGAMHDAVAAAWYFPTGDEYELFEFDIESAVLGERANQDEWPPAYTTWRASPKP